MRAQVPSGWAHIVMEYDTDPEHRSTLHPSVYLACKLAWLFFQLEGADTFLYSFVVYPAGLAHFRTFSVVVPDRVRTGAFQRPTGRTKNQKKKLKHGR